VGIKFPNLGIFMAFSSHGAIFLIEAMNSLFLYCLKDVVGILHNLVILGLSNKITGGGLGHCQFVEVRPISMNCP
jgi:hypothetical protein